MPQSLKLFNLLVFVILFAFSISFRADSAQANNMPIWNAQKLDWWVSVADNSEGEKSCEIHWVYDGVLDLSFQRSAKGRLYFGVQALKDLPELQPFAMLQQGQYYRADLLTGGTKQPVYGQAAGSDLLVVFVEPEVLDYDYLDHAERLIIRMPETSYNLPLESSEENFAVFRTCEENLNVPEKLKDLAQEAASGIIPKPSKSVDNSVDADTNVLPPKQKPLAALSEDAPQEGEQPEGAESTEDVATQEDLSVPPGMSKQSDKLLKDTQRSMGAPQKEPTYQQSASAAGLDPDTMVIADDVVFNDRETSLIQSLTKKLAMVEKEKEILRKQKQSYEAQGLVAQIRACEPTEDEDELDDSVLAKYEIAIDSLRAENEVLKEAVTKMQDSQTMDAENTALEISGLQQQVQELTDRNKELQESVYEYQEQLEQSLFDEVRSFEENRNADEDGEDGDTEDAPSAEEIEIELDMDSDDFLPPEGENDTDESSESTSDRPSETDSDSTMDDFIDLPFDDYLPTESEETPSPSTEDDAP